MIEISVHAASERPEVLVIKLDAMRRAASDIVEVAAPQSAELPPRV
jgi:hypothetical protein